MRFPFNGSPRVTNPFGTYNKVYLWDKHTGEDVALSKGTPVYAMVSGKVTFASIDRTGMGYGAYVSILNDGLYYGVAHLSRIDVKVGQTVKEGQRVGLSGGVKGQWGAGLSTGAHLHYEISNNPSFKAPFNSFKDPRKWINQHKKESDMADSTDVKHIYKYGPLGRTADKDGLKHYTGKSATQIINEHRNSPEGKARAAKLAKQAKDASRVPALEKEIAKLKSESGSSEDASKWQKLKQLLNIK